MKRILPTITLITFTLALSAQVIATPAENPGDFTTESPTHGMRFALSEAEDSIVALHFPEDGLPFLTQTLRFVRESSTGAGTDCVVAPMSLTHRPE